MQIKFNITPHDLVPHLESDIEYKSELSYFFSKVAEASILGHHKIHIGGDLAEWLVGDIEKNNKSKINLIEKHVEQIRNIGNNISTRGINNEYPHPYLEVVYGSASLSKNGKNWVVGHQNLLKFLEKPILLVEGFDDCEIFEFLLEFESERRPDMALSFDIQPVGGKGNMINGITKYSKKSGVIVSILDSDKYVPQGKESREYKKTRKKARNTDHIFCHSTTTPCLEAENFLPIQIVSMVSDKEDRQPTEFLIELNDNSDKYKKGRSLYLYYDLKMGPNKNKIEGNTIENNESQRSWIKGNYGEYWYELGEEFKSRSRTESTEYGYTIEVNVNIKYNSEFPKYGNNIIKKFINNSDAKFKFKQLIENEENKFWELHFADWFEQFIWYFISDHPANIGNR